MEELINKLCEYIEKAGSMNLDATDKNELSTVVDIYKDLKEVESMNNGYGRYGRESYGEYNEYDEYNNSYGRRGVDSRYRGDDYMDSMRGSYRNYEEARNEYNRGNYGAKEDGLKDLEYMMHAAMKFIKMIKSEATSPEEQEIVRKHIAKISEM